MAISHPLLISITRYEPELVVPATQTPRERKQLSDIDDQGSLRFHVPIFMFYKSCFTKKDPAKVIKDGLSKTLVFYYPLAGRIIEGYNRKLIVDCNGEGILFVEADADVVLEKLGDSIKPPCPYFDELLYNVPASDGITGCPLVLVQVTRFSCGGFCVGFRFNHTMMDAYGMKLFLKGLTELIGGASAPSILPVWQRHLLSARSPPRITCTHHEFDAGISNAWSDQEDTLIQRSFFFGDEEMHAIKDQLPNNSPIHNTKFELLLAFLWKCRTIALSLHPEEIVHLTYLINANGISSPLKLPVGYYGNAFITPAAVSKAGLLCSCPLGYAIELVKKVKDLSNEEYFRSVADLMVIKGRPELTKSWNFIVSDNRYVGFDEVDFGWGKPVHGGVPKAISNISFVVPVKNNNGDNGILIALSLPPLAMVKFQKVVHKMTSKNVF